MKRTIFAVAFAAGMLATTFLATGAGASPTNPNPNASCISASANGNPYFGGVHGVGQFHIFAHPYGLSLIGTIQTKVSDCQ